MRQEDDACPGELFLVAYEGIERCYRLLDGVART